MIKGDHTKCLGSCAQTRARHVLNVLEFSGAAPKYLTESPRTERNNSIRCIVVREPKGRPRKCQCYSDVVNILLVLHARCI